MKLWGRQGRYWQRHQQWLWRFRGIEGSVWNFGRTIGRVEWRWSYRSATAVGARDALIRAVKRLRLAVPK